MNEADKLTALNFAEACDEMGISQTDVRQALYIAFPPQMVYRLSKRFAEKMVSSDPSAIAEQSIVSPETVIEMTLFATACIEHGLLLPDLLWMVRTRCPQHGESINKRYTELMEHRNGQTLEVR